MEISIRKSDLVRELQLVQGIVERKTSIPVLSNVLVEAKGAELKLAATDLDVSLRCGCAAAVKTEGAVTLAAKKLYEIARMLPESDVLVKQLPDAWVAIECERSRFKMAGLPREDFPSLPDGKAQGGLSVPPPNVWKGRTFRWSTGRREMAAPMSICWVKRTWTCCDTIRVSMKETTTRCTPAMAMTITVRPTPRLCATCRKRSTYKMTFPAAAASAAPIRTERISCSATDESR
jgi:hypothetical protein